MNKEINKNIKNVAELNEYKTTTYPGYMNTVRSDMVEKALDLLQSNEPYPLRGKDKGGMGRYVEGVVGGEGMGT